MKTVLITGANKGIGFETAKQLAELGYFVYIGSRTQQRSTKTAEEGAKPIVRIATQLDRSDTGKFYKDTGEVPW